MKKRLAYALATLLLLTACGPGGPAAQAGGSTLAADAGILAGREPMSIEDAGAYYMEHVCPVNKVVFEFNELYLDTYAEAEAGESPSLAPLIELTAKMRDAHQGLADALSEGGVLWPAAVEEEMDPFIGNLYDGATSLDSLAKSETTEQFFAIMEEVQRKDAESGDAALVRKIRAKLGLLTDAEKSCKNYIDS